MSVYFKQVASLLTSFALLLGGYCKNNNTQNFEFKNEQLESQQIVDSNSTLKAFFLDVGTADCSVIKLPNGEILMIDAGENDDVEHIESFLNKENIKKIDYLVATHPHADHIGGMDEVISDYNVEKIYMPKVNYSSKMYKNLLNLIDEKSLEVISAHSGDYILDTDNLDIIFVAPNSEKYSKLNDYSAVIKIIYKNKSFIFMGDAEKQSESEIVDNIDSDVIKIGHHGSKTASSQDLLNKVTPEIAIISVGENNKYNFPAGEVLDRLLGIKTYRTDISGDILVETDGEYINVVTTQ